MTMQPASGPGRMPNPMDGLKADAEATRRDQRRLGALLLAEIRHQTVLLSQIVTLLQEQSAKVDAMVDEMGKEPNPYSVSGMGNGADETDSPFLGG